MRTSADGVLAIRGRERCVLKMYRDGAGLPTIGVGHLITKDEWSSGTLLGLGVPWALGLTDEQATALLTIDIGATESTINFACKTATFTQHQFDALTSFVFNIGGGAFLHSPIPALANAGHLDQIPGHMVLWNKIHDGAALVVDHDLEVRRAEEIAQWNTPDQAVA